MLSLKQSLRLMLSQKPMLKLALRLGPRAKPRASQRPKVVQKVKLKVKVRSMPMLRQTLRLRANSSIKSRRLEKVWLKELQEEHLAHQAPKR